MTTSLIGVMFPLLNLAIVAVIVVTVVLGVSNWHKKTLSPRLTVEATVVAKRSDTQFHHQHHGGVEPASTFHTTNNTTTYSVIFQVESGDRMKFTVSGAQYEQLAEGDEGRLMFQGPRYLDFTQVKTF